MKTFLITISLLAFITNYSLGQCNSISLPDSSFEMGTLVNAGTLVPGIWYTDDGCTVSASQSYTGDSSACSIGGGAFQKVYLDSNTTYYLSCYVQGGATDPFPALKINWTHYPISPSTDNWSLVSQSFNSGADTVAYVGFYSGSACFDQFRLTCSPLTNTWGEMEPIPSFVVNSVIAEKRYFTIRFSRPSKLSVIDLNGRIIETFQSHEGEIKFGSSYPPGVYLIKVTDAHQGWVGKIIKQL